jgi:hypothetical protein
MLNVPQYYYYRKDDKNEVGLGAKRDGSFLYLPLPSFSVPANVTFGGKQKFSLFLFSLVYFVRLNINH